MTQNMATNEIGHLTDEEQAKFAEFRRKANALTLEIGSLEIQKQRLLTQMSELEESAQLALTLVKVRLEVAPEQHCLVTQDGKLMTISRT